MPTPERAQGSACNPTTIHVVGLQRKTKINAHAGKINSIQVRRVHNVHLPFFLGLPERPTSMQIKNLRSHTTYGYDSGCCHILSDFHAPNAMSN
jgi:hypothetical protein